GNYLLGNGIGGIGVSLAYFYDEELIFASTDSLFIYGYSFFGVFFIITLWLLCNKIRKFTWDYQTSVYSTLMFLSILIYGITGSPIERDFWMIFIGIAFHIILKCKSSSVCSNQINNNG